MAAPTLLTAGGGRFFALWVFFSLAVHLEHLVAGWPFRPFLVLRPHLSYSDLGLLASRLLHFGVGFLREVEDSYGGSQKCKICL